MTKTWLASVSLLLLAALPCAAQDPAPEPTTAELLERLRELEEQVKQLQSKETAPAANQGAGDEFRLGEEPDEFRLDAPPAKAKEDEPPGPLERSVYRNRAGGYGNRHNYGYADDGTGIGFDFGKGIRLKIGGQIRARAEYRDPADLRIPGQAGRPLTDDASDASDFILLRTRINFDVMLGRHLRAFVELQDSRVWGDTETNEDTAEVFVRQAFVEIAEPFDLPLWVWAGRWKLPSLGDLRLIFTAEFNNVTRSWDGVQVFGHLGGTRTDPFIWFTAFAANVREGRVGTRTGDENDDFWFNGIYATVHGIGNFTVDLYGFWRHLSDRVFTSEKRSRLGDRKDFTLGARIADDWGFLGYSAEAAWQYGDQAGDRVRAWAAAAKGWIKFELDEQSHVAFLAEYAYASGDRDPDDGKIQTFDPLAPSVHRPHGRIDNFVWSNVHDVMLGVRYAPLKWLTFRLEGHAFWLDKRKDAWYFRPRTELRRDPTGRASSFVGSEVDFWVTAKVWDHLKIRAGYSRFFVADFVRDTGKNTPGRGSGADQDWAFLTLEIDF